MTVSGASPIPDSWLAPAACHRSIGGGRVGALTCGIVHKRHNGWDNKAQRSDHFSTVWCLRGTGRYHDAHGRTWDLVPGDIFHRFTDRAHGNELDPAGGWVEAYIGFGEPLAHALVAMGALDPAQPVRRAGLDLVLLRSLIQERDALRDAPDRDLPTRLGRLLQLHQELLARAGRSDAGAGPYDAALDQACRRLAEEPHVALRALARDCGLSYERFRKVFRARLGVSPHEYRIRRRIDLARTALHAGDRSVHQIASDLGYANPFQFSVQFRSLVGLSPSAYRRKR